MSLIKPAEMTTGYFKTNILGFQGSGKSFTAMLLAYGVAKTIGHNKIVYFDTEKGSDFFVRDMEGVGIEFFQVKSRAFSDVLTTIKECHEMGIEILVVDSLTHLWEELKKSYLKKKNREKMQIQDWPPVTAEWNILMESVVNEPLHMIMCGRATWEYEWETDDQGNRDLIKTRTKMRAHKETANEYDIVLEMEAITMDMKDLEKITNRKNRLSFKPHVGSKLLHRCHVIKDRSDSMNGMVIENPTFDDFKPYIEEINLGGKHFGVDLERTSEDRFSPDGKTDRQIYAENKKAALEEIQGVMTELWAGQSAEEKKSKIEFIEIVFETRAWSTVEKRSLEELEAVAIKLDQFIEAYNETKDIRQSWEKCNA